jgi:hypothetical protein
MVYKVRQYVRSRITASWEESSGKHRNSTNGGRPIFALPRLGRHERKSKSPEIHSGLY